MLKKSFLAILRGLFNHLLFRVRYKGLENIENAGKCVVCPNHSIWTDPFWIYFKSKDMWIMAKAELFNNKLMAFLLRTYNVFPIKRGQKDASSLIHAINAIEKNDNAKLLVFPEGTRIKKDKERGRAKNGPVFIASKAGVPIIPVHITKNPRLFSKVIVEFGKPIELPEGIHEDKEKMQEMSNYILDKIYEMNDKPKKKK